MKSGFFAIKLLLVFLCVLISVASATSTKQTSADNPVKWLLEDDFETESPLDTWTMVDTFNQTQPTIENPQVTEIRKESATQNRFMIKKPETEGVLGNRKALTFKKLPVNIEVGETYTFYATCNGGPIDTPYGNGGVRYDDLYIAPGTVLQSPLN